MGDYAMNWGGVNQHMPRWMRRFTALALLALASLSLAQASEEVRISGYVHELIAGTAGPGVASVRVSNGREIVNTDADGRYEISMRSGDTVFVIKPSGYREVRRTVDDPGFWRHHHPAPVPTVRYGGIPAQDIRHSGGDFLLVPALRRGESDPLDVLVFGDPQPKSLRDVDYYARDIVAPILAAAEGAAPAHLGLSLGDIVDDDLSLYPAMIAITDTLRTPWLHVAGNHDLDFDASGDDASLLTFRQHFGPDSYAWEEANANFVVLDDVIYQPGQRPVYIGGFREDQFNFLEAYLSGADRERLLVIALHIPLFDPDPTRTTFRRADRERLFALLKDFPKVLVLSSHTHEQSHYFHDVGTGWQGDAPLHEYNVGASCGAYWSGVADAEGIPDATMSDGTPNGYARLRVDAEGRYTLRWFVARDATLDSGIALHAPKLLRLGAFPAFGVYANVLMGHAGSVVEYRIDGGDWRPMRRVDAPDPRLLIENVADSLTDTLRGYDRSPEATASSHVWRGSLPTDLSEGEHLIEVRTFDQWRGELRAETRYRLIRHSADEVAE